MNKTRYIVKPIVCDDEVFDTKTNESVVICNSFANAILISDILNFENERPNKAESWLEYHDKESVKYKTMWEDMKGGLESYSGFFDYVEVETMLKDMNKSEKKYKVGK